MEDLKQRIPYYLSDFFDGFVGEKTLQVANDVNVNKLIFFFLLSLSMFLVSGFVAVFVTVVWRGVGFI